MLQEIDFQKQQIMMRENLLKRLFVVNVYD